MMAPIPTNTVGKSPSKRPAFMLSVANEADQAPSPQMTGSATNNTDAPKSQCSSLSDGESFEGFGEGDPLDNIGGGQTLGVTGGVDLELVPHLNSTTIADEESGSISRHSWSRTSLRRTPSSHEQLPNRRWGSMRHSGKRQIGSNALASQLYRSSSFNSSGRSSNCDNTEDMYSDVSLEDVQDINLKLEILQRQVSNLADSQHTVDDRTVRTKTEHAVLQARYDMLEEQLRDAELRAEERLADEQKRHRELLARAEREAALQNENCLIKMRTIEEAARAQREEAQRLRLQCDKQAADLHAVEEKLEAARDSCAQAQDELAESRAAQKRHERERAHAEELMVELGREVERLRADSGPALPTTSPESIRLEELHQELEDLREQKRVLEEQNEELQAIVLNRGVEEGRNLLNGTANSLAQELGQMDQLQLQVAFQEKEDENLRMKTYIDSILLNIVENYPQLLEVKNLSSK